MKRVFAIIGTMLALSTLLIVPAYAAAIERERIEDLQDLQSRDEGATKTIQTRSAANTGDPYYYSQFTYETLSTYYNTENLIKYPYYTTSGSTISGVTFIENGYGWISANGTANNADGAIFECVHLPENTADNNMILPAGTYTFTCLTEAGGYTKFQAIIGYKKISNNQRSYAYDNGQGTTITLTEECRIDIRIIIRNGYTANNVIFKPMLVAAATGATYTPYWPATMYSNMETSEQNGYQDGYTDGVAAVENIKNLFQRATTKRLIIYTGEAAPNNTAIIDLSGTYFNNIWTNDGIKIPDSTVAGWYDAWPGLTKYILEFTWDKEWDLNYYSPITVSTTYNSTTQSVSSIISGTIENSTINEPVLLSIEGTETKGLYNLTTNATITVGNLSLSIQDPEINKYSFNVGNAGFQSGYIAGWQDATTGTGNTAYELGKTAGWNEGYKLGKKEGTDIAAVGNFNSLITAVIDVPVKTFQSLFNFEILGVNMQAAVAALLTLGLIIIIIKKVI